MNNFVWIIESDKDSFFGSLGVSGSYIIPKGTMKVSPEYLPGGRLWVILRGHDDRIFLSIVIKKIEEIIEGYYNRDFLITVDLLSSIRLVERYSDTSKYIIEATEKLNFGLTQVKDNLRNELTKIALQNINIKITFPSKQKLSEINIEPLPTDAKLLAKSAIKTATSNYNLNQIWAAGTGNKLGPYSNFASALIDKNVSPELHNEVVNLLVNLDPTRDHLEYYNDFSHHDSDGIKKPPNIDCDFNAIDPEKIHSRKFIGASVTHSNDINALKKTERAEKFHQEMLKDISEHLLSLGVTPYESASIDLMYKSKKCIEICEIKSATPNNILSQSSKGAFQLSCYTDEIEKLYSNVSSQLILQKTDADIMEVYVQQILSRMNVRVLYYDHTKMWPDKLPGLPI